MRAFIRRVVEAWGIIAAFANLTISTVAALAYAHVITPHPWLLALLISWSNICAAIHRFAIHQKMKDTQP